MSDLDRATTLFRGKLVEGVRVGSAASLARVLAERLAEAKAARPAVAADESVFIARLAASIEEGEDAETALGRLYASDLYLACACQVGDAAALAAFEAEFHGTMRGALSRAHRSPAELDDAVQAMREKLLVGDAAAPPRIAQYAGRGPLLAWVAVAATRTARSAARKTVREAPASDEAVFDRASVSDDPALALVKRRYRAEFKAAFEEAFRQLSARERNLLRMQHMDGLSVDEIGAVYGVHRATAARWARAAREAMFSKTRSELERTMNVDRHEFESIARVVQSQLDLSLSTLFRSGRS